MVKNTKLKEKTKMDEAMDMMVENGLLNMNLNDILGKNGLMQQMSAKLLEKMLCGEMDHHLGYGKYGRLEEKTDLNTRNGYGTKRLITNQGALDLKVPRDRDGTFEPILIEKRQRRFEGLDDKILSLYARGMTISDIRLQLFDLYGTELSEGLISEITNRVLEEVNAWQTRPLEAVYAVVYFDCIMVKVRQDRQVIKKAVYVALGVNSEGQKDVLGLWISENEGSKFWRNVFTELSNRGVKDILIACTDNLTGMSDAIEAVFPKTAHQLCIVHQIRTSLKSVSYKDYKAVCADLKPIYQATNEEEASRKLDEFAEKWDDKYSGISKSWRNNWSNLIIFLDLQGKFER